MAEPFAKIGDVVVFWRPLSPGETIRADALLGYASQMIRRRVPQVDARLLSGALVPSDVRLVTVAVVRRMMEGGDRQGIAQTLTSRGPFTTSVRYADADPQESYLTAGDLLMLGESASTGKSVRMAGLSGSD